MEIYKVQQLVDGYLVNDSFCVPSNNHNRHCQNVEDWIAGGGFVIPLPPNDYSVLNEYDEWVDDPIKIAETQRAEEIDTARETAGLKDVTVTQAESAIDNIIDPATDIETLKARIKLALKKMVPYIIL